MQDLRDCSRFEVSCDSCYEQEDCIFLGITGPCYAWRPKKNAFTDQVPVCLNWTGSETASCKSCKHNPNI